MSNERRTDTEPQLVVPGALQPQPGLILPQLTFDTLEELRNNGWSTLGTMVALTDPSGDVMLLEHKGRGKNLSGAWGPLGETSQRSDSDIEQPIETLFRGIQEELGVQYPKELNLSVRPSGGWVINQGPRGNDQRDKYVCAISFPIFIPSSTRAYLESFTHGSEEISDLRFVAPDDIMAMDEESLRPGVKGWLSQLISTGLLVRGTHEPIQLLDFSEVPDASLYDVQL